MTDRDLMKQALDALNSGVNVQMGRVVWTEYDSCLIAEAVTALNERLAQPEQEPVLQDIEQYRLQMAGISTAAIGYWKEGDGIHPDYDTLALRDVAKLYAKYDALYKTQRKPLTDDEREQVAAWMMQQGYATGHGDTVEDLLKELEWQIRESEREACANVCKQQSLLQLDERVMRGIDACTDAIRARSNT